MSTTWSAYTVFTDRVCNAPSHGDADPSLTNARSQVMSALYGIGTRSNCDAENCDDLLMPPDQPLATSELMLIERWYDIGAPCD